jgi:hypothetical protein
MNIHAFFTRKSFAIFIIFTALSSSLLASDVYKWTDAEGTIHYSDKKPSDISSKNMKIKTSKSTNTRISAQEQAQKLDETKSQQLATQAQKLQDDTVKRENDAMCQTLRDNLVKFKENSRIKINENGETRFLTPEEINTKTTEYNKIIEDKCS